MSVLDASPHRFVLLIEDNDDDVMLTRRALAKVDPGAELVIAGDGLTALDICFGDSRFSRGKRVPFLILLDLKIPKLKGLEVLQCFRSEARTQHVPIVILSASKEEIDLIESKDLGANAYIAKPIDPSKLAEVMERVKAG